MMNKKTSNFKQKRSARRALTRFLKSIKRKKKKYEYHEITTNFFKDKSKTQPTSPRLKTRTNTNNSIIDEYKLSSTLKFLFESSSNFTNNLPNIPENGVLYVPEFFSLTERPKESYQYLKDLLYTLRYPRNSKLKISFKNCKKIDLDASVINDIILHEYIRALRICEQKRVKLETKEIDVIDLVNEDVKKFLYATGTHKIIKNIHFDFPNILTFDLAIGNKKRGIGYKEIESTKLVQHIDGCLDKMNKQLTSDARESFGEIIGEVMANAEEHNITDYHYSIGHFEESEHEGAHIGVFQLVIFNFGESIYERFNNSDVCKNTDILTDMKSLSEKYTRRGLFGWFNGKRFEEETLWTLYSLQDGVSSVDKKRGNGTIKFIENFLELSDNGSDKTSSLHLFSGNTKIKFDGTYQTIPKPNNTEFKIIPFNIDGSLDEKPDEKFVNFVDNFFPGTMIYTNIRISEKDIEKHESN